MIHLNLIFLIKLIYTYEQPPFADWTASFMQRCMVVVVATGSRGLTGGSVEESRESVLYRSQHKSVFKLGFYANDEISL